MAIILSSLLLTMLLVSFRPFQPAGAPLEDGASAGGDIVNQLGFGSLGALALFALFTFVDRRVLTALLSPWWLVMLGFLALSVLNATDRPSGEAERLVISTSWMICSTLGDIGGGAAAPGAPTRAAAPARTRDAIPRLARPRARDVSVPMAAHHTRRS